MSKVTREARITAGIAGFDAKLFRAVVAYQEAYTAATTAEEGLADATQAAREAQNAHQNALEELACARALLEEVMLPK